MKVKAILTFTAKDLTHAEKILREALRPELYKLIRLETTT